MSAVLDSSTLISLAWAGQLGLLAHAPVPMVVPDVVRAETVASGLASGHPDAAAIEAAIAPLAAVETEPAESVDQAVLAAAVRVGTLVSNDLALGRRAGNLGVRWLATADLLLLCVKTGTVSQDDGRMVLNALHAAGGLTSALLTSYLEEI